MAMTLEQVRDWHCEKANCIRSAVSTGSAGFHELMADAIDAHLTQPARVPDGWKLAMWVLQSRLYAKLPEEERAVCDALVQENPYIAAKQSTP